MCPAHLDRTPSLSIDRGVKGWLMYCHRGCSTKAVMEALDLPVQALYYDYTDTPSTKYDSDVDQDFREWVKGTKPPTRWELKPHQTLQDVLYEVFDVSGDVWATVQFQWEDMLIMPFPQVWEKQSLVILDAICGDLLVDHLDAGWEFTVESRRRLKDKIVEEWRIHS